MESLSFAKNEDGAKFVINNTSNANNTNLNPFTNPVSTIPVYIFQFLGTGYETSVARAWGAALVLLLIVSILFALTRLISRKKRDK